MIITTYWIHTVDKHKKNKNDKILSVHLTPVDLQYIKIHTKTQTDLHNSFMH